MSKDDRNVFIVVAVKPEDVVRVRNLLHSSRIDEKDFVFRKGPSRHNQYVNLWPAIKKAIKKIEA